MFNLFFKIYISNVTYTFFLREVFLWTWGSPTWLGLLDRKLEGTTCLHIPSTGAIKAYYTACLFLCGCWESELRSPCLCKSLTNRTTSPASFTHSWIEVQLVTFLQKDLAQQGTPCSECFSSSWTYQPCWDVETVIFLEYLVYLIPFTSLGPNPFMYLCTHLLLAVDTFLLSVSKGSMPSVLSSFHTSNALST